MTRIITEFYSITKHFGQSAHHFCNPSLVARLLATRNSSALNKSIETENPIIVEAVLRAGARITPYTFNEAMRTRNSKIILAFIEAGARATTPNALKKAIWTKDPNVVNAVIKAGATITPDALLEAIEWGNAGVVKAVINAGATITSAALHAAFKTRLVHIVYAVAPHVGAPLMLEALNLALESKDGELNSSFSTRSDYLQLIEYLVKTIGNPLDLAIHEKNIKEVHKLRGVDEELRKESINLTKKMNNADLTKAVLEPDPMKRCNNSRSAGFAAEIPSLTRLTSFFIKNKPELFNQINEKLPQDAIDRINKTII